MILRRFIHINNILLKTISLILAFIIWNILIQTITSIRKIDIPICVYNAQNLLFDTHTTARITLRGSHYKLDTLKTDTLALHVDGSTLHEGKNMVTLDNTHIFIPEGIEMVYCNPSMLTITVKNQSSLQSLTL